MDMPIYDRRKHAVVEIFEDINSNLSKIKGFTIMYGLGDEETTISCWLDVDKYKLADKYIQIYSKKQNKTVYLPLNKIILIEII
ncbi:MAG: hypothetical protein WC197_02725 [Candidatus Gastranaerophilaceae bacterium]|jgi:hypothetical protein